MSGEDLEIFIFLNSWRQFNQLASFNTLLMNLCFSVQHECIPQAILSMDVLCQAKSGMGKTAVFVLATLQQLEPVDGQVGKKSKCLELGDWLSK